MGFWLHLRLIMWKNFTIRKRQKVRCAIDILWPLILFIMLVALRIVGYKENIHECHFEPRALPSAGMAAFLRGVLCTLNNTCHPVPDAVRGGGPGDTDRSRAMLQRLLRHVEALAEDGRTPRLWEALGDAGAALARLADDLRAQPPGQGQLTPERLGELTQHVTKVVQLLDRPEARIDLNRYLALLVEQQERAARQVRRRLRVGEGVAQLLAALRLVCGGAGGDAIDALVALDRQAMNESMAMPFTPDPDASAQCNEHFRTLEQNPNTRLLWRWLKPFVRGKILYAPSTEETRRVMGRVDAFFDSFRRLQALARTWAVDVLPPALRRLDTLASTLAQYEAPAVRRTLEAVPEGRNLRRTLKWLRLLRPAYERAAHSLTLLHEALDCFKARKTAPRASEAEAVAEGLRLLPQRRLWAVVAFEDGVRAPFASYKIRVDSGLMDDTHFLRALLHDPGPRMNAFIDLKYFSSGFIYIQDLVEHSLAQEMLASERVAGAGAVPDDALPGFVMQQFPYPCHIRDRFSFAVSRTFPLVMTLSWVYGCASLVKAVVVEKEARLAEAQRVAGVADGALWLAWFLDGFLAGALSAAMLALLLLLGRVLERSAATLVLCFLLSYCAAAAAFACLLSAFFSRASVAAGVSGMLFVLSYLPYATIDLWGSAATAAVKYAAGLLCNVAFGFGCLYLSAYEQLGVGAEWSRVGRSPFDGDSYSLLACMLALLADALLYVLLAWYISNVWPGRHGIPKPLLFPLSRTFWRGVDEKKFVPIQRDEESSDEVDDELDAAKNEEFSGGGGAVSPGSGPGPWRRGMPVVEAAPAHLVPGIRLRRLSKVFSGGRVAVDQLSLTFYEGHITAFLGHNGAGKTTVISMLTGLLPPTSGTAFVRGLDVRYHMPDIRRSLGVCPQHSVLYDKLTAAEHLWLAARLRGRPAQRLRTEIPELLRDLRLQRQAGTQAGRLSGGARRKLCVAAAFVGDCRRVESACAESLKWKGREYSGEAHTPARGYKLATKQAN